MQYSFCIAEKEAWRAKIVLQEGQLYCNRGSLAAGGTVLQYSLVGSRFVLQYKLYCELWEGHCSNDTAWGAGSAQAGTGRRWARVAGQTARSRRWASVRAGSARQADVSWRGVQGERGVQASGRNGRRRTHRRQAWQRRAAGAGMGARGAGREREEHAAWASGARGVGVPVRAGWACWLVS